MLERLRALTRRQLAREVGALQAAKIGALGLSLASAVLVPVVLGLERYGRWQLVLALVGLWQALDLTGLGIGTQTRLSLAVGARDGARFRDEMAMFVRVTLAVAVAGLGLLALGGPLVARWLYADAGLGWLALVVGLTYPSELLFALLLHTIRARRWAAASALLVLGNQFVLTSAALIAVGVQPSVAALAAGRVAYSAVTLGLGLWLYARTRMGGPAAFDAPPLRVVLGRALGGARLDAPAWWRFGVVNALDKNVAGLFVQLPVALVGAWHGAAAAGLVGFGVGLIAQTQLPLSGALEAAASAVPRAVGRGDYAALRVALGRALLGLALVGGVAYGVFAWVAGGLIPAVWGADYAAAVPAVRVLAVYGVVTAVGGVLGPVYRSLDRVGAAFVVKLAALGLMAGPGVWLVARWGAVGAAWAVAGVFALSVAGTWGMLAPRLRAAAQAQAGGGISSAR